MKIVVLGMGGVGKSCCTLRYLFGTFQTGYDPTVGLQQSNFTKQVELDGKNITLEILDTAGQEEFKAFRDASLRQGEGYLLVYSIDDRASFEDVQKTYTFVTRGNEGRPFRVMVIGNKSDLESERKVTTQEAAAWATQNKISHAETSAKTNQNIAPAFETLLRQVLALTPQEKPAETVKDGGCGCSLM